MILTQATPASKHRTGFTLVEIMIVVGILAIILAIAGTTWIRQRQVARQRSCQEQLAKIDGAKQEWGFSSNQPDTAVPGWDDLVTKGGYLNKIPQCPGGGTYTLNDINTRAECSVTDPYNHNDQ